MLDTIHPKPKATETGEGESQEEGAVGGEVEEQVMCEVWESQDEEITEGEGEEEEESDGEFVSQEIAKQTTVPIKKKSKDRFVI